MAEAKRNPGRSKEHPAPKKPVVLMTGATGFLGGAIGQALAANDTVVGLDRTPKDMAHAETVRCDFTADESVDEALHEVTSRFGTRIASVVHLAGYFDFSGEPNPLYREVNVEGTRRLLRKLQALDVEQFVYASTMLVHAPTEPGVPISESSRVEPRWAYPQSKLETESVVAHEHGAIPSVVLRIAGVYSPVVQPPTLAHQISWIYERQIKGRVFPGETSHGLSFVHLDDLVDAVVRTVDRRGSLPPDLKLLVGEATTLSYAALQNRLGTLIHGELWETETVPKPLAKLGARLQEKLEAVVPDAIDRGKKPFVKPFMVELADDHYELDVSQAQTLLDWSPRHALREELPAMVETLKADPRAWYQANRIAAPEWLETITEHPAAAHALLEKYERSVRLQHTQNLWAHFLNLGLGLWLITSPPILGYPDGPMTLSNIASGALVMLFSLMSLSRHMAWARFANAGVGVWLLFAPLVFWAPTAAGYLNDTLVGALVIGFSFLVRPAPGVGVAARTTGPDVPPGRQPGLRAGNLDEQVGPIHRRVQPARLLDAGLGVVRQMRRHLQADVAVDTAALVVDRAQHVAGVAHIAHHHGLVDLRRGAAGGEGVTDFVVVVAAAADCLVENRRVRGDAAQAVLADAALEFAAGDLVAGEIVQPVALPVCRQLEQGIGLHWRLLDGGRTKPALSLSASFSAALRKKRAHDIASAMPHVSLINNDAPSRRPARYGGLRPL